VSVHDKEHYADIKKLLDIPPEEPIFILRGQDRSAIPVLNFYYLNNAQLSGPEKWINDLADAIGEFSIFANNHPERMKEPD
jgi:hypothetical protein